jgi:YHS domain-containing protein
LVAAWLLALTVRRGTRDPVCGMTVDRTAGGPTTVRGGRRYFFCGEECRARFDAEPERYAAEPH